MAVALLTDFGTSDIYTGVIKAVMFSINPALRFLDITHWIEPQNVRQAAFALLDAYRYYPKGTVFLVVVDPGVGSTRRPIAVQAGGYLFVAPDNGVLSYTLSQLGEYNAVEIALGVDGEISKTFHGRDVFAPAAAKLASGIPLHELGEPLPVINRLPMPDLMIDPPHVLGEVTQIDRFGNLITSIGYMRWLDEERISLNPAFGDHQTVPVFPGNAQITVNDQSILGIRHTYSEAERGSLLALIGSSHYLEVSVNQGNAAQRLDAVIGDRVELKVGEPDATVLD